MDYIQQGLQCQLNDILVNIWKKKKKKPYNLETMIVTSVVCIVNIKKVLYKDLKGQMRIMLYRAI